MTAITGSNTKIALKIGSTYGTAESIGAGDKLIVESLNHSENTAELTSNSIGAGINMTDESERGQVSPSITFDKIMTYDDAGIAAMAQFMGTANFNLSPDTTYTHSLLYNETHNSKWATIAFQGHSASAGVFEYPSCAATRLELRAENPPNYAMQAMDFLGNEQVISGQTNTYTDFDSATVTDTEKIVAQPEDEFLINAQAGGALASPGDRVSITSAVLTLNKPQEFVPEIKGSTGNSEPVSSQGSLPLDGQLVVTFKELDDFTYFTAHQAGTEYKASLTIQGTDVGSTPKFIEWNLPRLKIVTPPDHGPNDPGRNPLTVTFKCLHATAAPTGMIDEYPYFRIRNEQSSGYLA